MVYNRYLELENMVNQFKLSEGISNVDGQPKLRLKDALQLSRSPAGSGGGFCCSDDFETAKMLIHSVSEVLSQVLTSVLFISLFVVMCSDIYTTPSQLRYGQAYRRY